MTRMLGRSIRITIGERRFQDSLRVAFSVEKTLGSAAHMGRGQLDVWNLNPDSRAQLDKPGTQVVVEAGYGKDLSVLFSADVLSDAASNLSRIRTVRATFSILRSMSFPSVGPTPFPHRSFEGGS